MKRKILYALGAIVLVYLSLWLYVVLSGGIENDVVTGTPNEDAQAIAEKIEINLHEYTDQCNYVVVIKKLGYPKIITGKDGRKYLANAFVKLDKGVLILRIDVSGLKGEHGGVGWDLDMCNFKVEGK